MLYKLYVICANRVTSGLVVLAKSKSTAARISEEIRDKATTKVIIPVYLMDFRYISYYKVWVKISICCLIL